MERRPSGVMERGGAGEDGRMAGRAGGMANKARRERRRWGLNVHLDHAINSDESTKRCDA